MRIILITGGAGFIGSNFIPYFLEKNLNYSVVNLDLLAYAGNSLNLKEVENNSNYKFIKGDICERKLVASLFKEYNFNGVIYFAAESHTDNFVENPDTFVKTNVFATFTLLDVAKNYWMDSLSRYKAAFKNARFHHISTDEVYGTLGKKGLFTEQTPYAPNTPCSASKASSDFSVRSYFHRHSMNLGNTNFSYNYSLKQHNEKLIPKIIRKALSGDKIHIYGDGKNLMDI